MSVASQEAMTGEGVGRVRLRFLPDGPEVRVPPGVSLFDAASWNGVAIDSTCGGYGTCKKCKVRIVEGELPVSAVDPRAFTPDELRDGWRLACRAQASCDLVIDVPPLQTRPKAATVGVGRQVILRPSVQKRYLELSEPTLQDQASDLERIFAAMDDLELRVGVDVVRTLPQLVRASDWKVTAVVVDDELIGVEAGDTTGRIFGIAFDLGTTTVVATLLDLSTGTPVAVRSILNRQQPYGADVIRRISATMMDPTVLPKLQELAQGTLADLVGEVLEHGEVAPEEVYEVALAGNATMTQLLLGVDPEPVGVAPFIMAASSYPLMRASDFGVTVHPRAHAHVFPALGAYVGGDIVSGLLASGMTRDKRLRLFIDVGTNCEIVLSDGDRILATAAPAGPAFEGGAIRCGMRAADGAIEVIKLTADPDDDTEAVELGVIGDVVPKGLCGSGLVDAVSELVKSGLLDHSGRFIPDEAAAELHPVLAERLVAIEGERIFVLAWAGEPGDPEGAVYLSQRDVRELQFAKASIATGWALLVEELGVKVADIQQVLLAGSFGSYLSPASAVRIGLVPKLALPRIVAAGNVAGEGAKMILLSAQERAAAAALVHEVEYVELSDRPDFNDLFIDQLKFPA